MCFPVYNLKRWAITRQPPSAGEEAVTVFVSMVLRSFASTHDPLERRYRRITVFAREV